MNVGEPQADCRNSTQVLILGAAIDAGTMAELARVDRWVQVQTWRLQWALVHAIESALGRAVDVAATVPVRDWPFVRRIWWGGRAARRSGKWKVESGKGDAEGDASIEPASSALSTFHSPLSTGHWIQMPMVNVLGLKQLWRLAGSWAAVLDWGRRHRAARSKVIISYGLIQPHLLAGLALRGVTGAKVVAVLTDPPLVYHDEGWLRRAAKWVDRRLLAALLRRLDGVIALTDGLARTLAPGVPAMVMEGIVSDEVERWSGKWKVESGMGERDGSLSTFHLPLSTKPFTIMYAGQLEADYGVRVLLEAFGKLEGDGYRLWLFGRGAMEEEIRAAAGRDKRVEFFGFQGPDVIFPRMAEADAMVVPRPVEDRIAPFSFPSKLLEYMAMGKIVVCSDLPGIPADYRPHLVMADPLTADSLADALRRVAGWPADERRQREQGVHDFIWTHKTQKRQGQRIVAFLDQIAHGAQTT